jgi:hypothetical protein
MKQANRCDQPYVCVHVMYIMQETQNNQILVWHGKENFFTAQISVVQILWRQHDVKPIQLYKEPPPPKERNSIDRIASPVLKLLLL